MKDYKVNATGDRIDQRNLIEEWKEIMTSKNKAHKFIWNASDFRSTDMTKYDHVMGNARNKNFIFKILLILKF